LKRLIDFYINSLLKFFDSGGQRIHRVGFVAGRVSFFFTVPILLNLLSLNGFSIGLFNYELLPGFWPLFLIIVGIYILIDRYVTNFIMTRSFSGEPPKFAFEIVFWYVVVTITLLFLSFIVIP